MRTGSSTPRTSGACSTSLSTVGAQLVYGSPTNPPPHGLVRNLSSTLAKTLFTRLLATGNIPRFSSFRLMLGDVGRGVAAYMGPGSILTWP